MRNIHERALEIVGRYLKSEAEVIAILQELDCSRLYLERDCKSLFEYATRVLRLSEATAYTFIIVGRNVRDEAQCTHLNRAGVRCTHTRYLQGHHIQPKEFGGEDKLENLTTLCSFHHRQMHQKLLL